MEGRGLSGGGQGERRMGVGGMGVEEGGWRNAGRGHREGDDGRGERTWRMGWWLREGGLERGWQLGEGGSCVVSAIFPPKPENSETSGRLFVLQRQCLSIEIRVSGKSQ